MIKPHGIDFGRWTQMSPEPVENPPLPIDFVIGGVSSGDYTVNHFLENVPFYKQTDRFMAYHFYEPWARATAEIQADKFIENGEIAGARFYWIDFEDTDYFTLGKSDVVRLRAMVEYMESKGKRVGIYANIDDFELIVKYDPELAKTCELWIAYPDENPDPEDWPYGDEERLGRPWSSVRFLQYSWKGYAPAYGAVNNKKSMDLNVFQGNMIELDAWLAIGEETDPGGPGTPGENQTGVYIPNAVLLEIGAHLELVTQHAADAFALITAATPVYEEIQDEDPPEDPPVIDPPEDPPVVEDPPDPPASKYRKIRFIPGAKDWAHWYKVDTANNGKTKLEQGARSTRITQPQVFKALAVPEKIGGVWTISADDDEIVKNFVMAGNLEVSINGIDVDPWDVLLIRHPESNKLGFVIFDPSRGEWKDTETKEFWRSGQKWDK